MEPTATAEPPVARKPTSVAAIVALFTNKPQRRFSVSRWSDRAVVLPGDRLGLAGNRKVDVWDVATGSKVGVVRGHWGVVSDGVVAGGCLVTACNLLLRSWRADSLAPLSLLQLPHVCYACPRLVVSCGDGVVAVTTYSRVDLVSVSPALAVRATVRAADWVVCMAALRDGRLACARGGGIDVFTLRPEPSKVVFPSGDRSVTGMCAMSDGVLATMCVDRVDLLDDVSGAPLLRINHGSADCLSRFVSLAHVSATVLACGCTGGTIELWDTRVARLRCILALSDRRSARVGVLSDGRVAAVGGTSVAVWSGPWDSWHRRKAAVVACAWLV